MKKLKPAALILLLFSMLLIPVVKAPVLEGWKYSKILEFDDGWEGLQVNFNVTYGAASDGVNFNSQVDFDDLRFYDLYAGVLLPAWNETTVSGSYVTVWLKLDESLSVIMYYGADSAESYWDIDAVFEDVIGDVVLALPMNEGFGSTIDDYSGNNNDGIVYNGVWVDGKYGSSVECNGASTYIEVSNSESLNVTHDFTLSLWISRTEIINWFVLFDKRYNNAGFSIASIGDGQTFFKVFQDSGDFGAYGADVPDFDVGVFTQLTFIFGSDSVLQIYQDSIWMENITSTKTGNIVHNAQSLRIGGNSIVGQWANGTLDEMNLFNSSLSITEVSNMYNYYPDSTIIEGSVLCRIWVGVMPSVSFGSEVSRDYASRGEFLAAALIASIICVPLLLLVIWGVKKRS